MATVERRIQGVVGKRLGVDRAGIAFQAPCDDMNPSMAVSQNSASERNGCGIGTGTRKPVAQTQRHSHVSLGFVDFI